ncbi:hypothetical protein [Pseudomonas sp. DSP3-2-2]|uniref:hypothetical protein n=1 Tax=unclassified Pseudomonas TaxID=196821 RepID=UPI003CF36820
MTDDMQGLDGERTAQQELFFDLEDSGAILGWSAVELDSIALRIDAGGYSDDAAALLSICKLLKNEQGRISAYADEAKDGRIVRVGLE